MFFFESQNCLVSNSIILNATFDGILIDTCTEIDVKWCNISFCFNGIKVKESSYGEYVHNYIGYHRVYGIFFDVQTSHNLIYGNTFDNNQLNDHTGRLSYAWDDGYNNTFYDIDTYTGNWWSNIDSYAYFIAGYANSVDIFPLNPVETSTPNGGTNESTYALLLFIIGLACVPTVNRIRRSKA